ncbi:MAG: 3-hydroxyacyl-CoA dehydrogenase/enoyl-CoA hydratase family protein [Bacteroidota bacterium]
MSNRIIRKIAVLGSGIMGSRIALHFAGAGLQVLLLDIISAGSDEKTTTIQKNKIVNDSLQTVLKSNPSPAFYKDVVKKIRTGNFTDNMKDISDADWIIEVVVEKLDIKKQIFESVEKFRKPGTLITTNTSGIPIHLMTEGRTDDFKKHFCGTHFFNPPRYLRLLEIIPTEYTDSTVIEFLLHFGDVILGKTTVLCKDTPAFIANRIGVFSMMTIMNIMEKQNLSIDEIEVLTGPIFGRPKSATFRTADVVGIDTLVKVSNGVFENCINDEAREQFKIPSWLNTMVENKWLGDKSGNGFFKKNKGSDGEKNIEVLDLKTLQYLPRQKVKFTSVDTVKQIEDVHTRIKLLFNAGDKAGQFYKDFHYALFSYISNRIPEISDDIYRIDEAMKAGFGWEIGAFESWDAIGFISTAKKMKESGYMVSGWIDEMISKGFTSFFKKANGNRFYYSIATQTYLPMPGGTAFLVMKNFENQTIWKNNNCRTYHLGDDIIGLEWSTKMNSIGGEVLEGIQKSIALSEEKYKGLVIANEGNNFSAGANVGMIFMLALEQDYDEIDMAIQLFQNTMMRVRYSSIPVVIAPHGLALGGGCEICLHADKVIAAAETYTGLVEVGIGVIPGGGGTKEFVLRAADEMHNGEPETITLQNRFLNIATGKVATSAHEAFQMGIYRKGTDAIAMNLSRRISMAKNAAIEIYDNGYTMPVQRSDIKVPGRMALGALHAGINAMWRGNYASEHDVKIAKKLAYVMCGGDLSEPTFVSEQYLLNLEREAFLSLTGEKKTLERIQSIIKSGKPLRN